MTLIINEFKVFHLTPDNLKRNIKLFHVIKSNFAICVTNDHKVYAFGEKDLIQQYFGYEEINIDNNYVLISELCDQNIEQFYCFFWIFYSPKVCDNKLFGSGSNDHGQLAKGYKSEQNEYLKSERIDFFR